MSEKRKIRKKDNKMKGKKILISLLAAAVAAGTMAFPAFAAFETVEKLSETDVLGGYSALTEDGTIALSSAEAFETSRDAVTEYTTDTVVYNVSGKVTVNGTSWVNILKASATGVENVKTVKFIGLTSDAEINIANGPTLLAWQGHALNVEFENLTLSNSDPKWVGDAGHATNYFTAWLRCTDAANCSVSYKNCTFTNGSCNNQYGKTVYTDCSFNNASEYCLWLYGGDTEVTGTKNTFVGKKGVKLYSEDATKAVNATIENAEFDISGKPAVVSSTWGKLELNNVDASKCQYGILSSEPNNHTKDGALINDTLADSTIDGKEPTFVAKVGNIMFTNTEAAKKEAGSTGTVEAIVAKVGDTYYSTVEEAVAAAQALTTDKWHIAKITLLTADALDISYGPDNYVSYNITQNDTIITGERIADDAHKSYYKLTNASTLYIPADVSSIILQDVRNLCRIELAKGADVTLKLNGDNELAGNIFVPEGAKLTIEDITANGTGRLAVYNTADKKYLPRGMNAFGAGDGYSAAIGGSQTQNGGEIVIKSGEIEAYSNYGSAIGAGQQKTAKVTILSGKVKAEASYGCAIGGGQQSAGDVTISGGIIDAKSDRSAPIGGGNQATDDSNIVITGGDITVARDFGSNLFGNSNGEAGVGASISGGSFNTDVSDYCEDGFTPKLVNGKYTVDNSADTIKLLFKQADESDNTLYNIVLSGNGMDINRLNAAEFKFALTTTDAITYEIAAADGLALIPQAEGMYEFHFDGKDFNAEETPDTGVKIVIGTVKFEGYGKFTFSAEAGRATATTTEDNLVTDFVVGGGTGKGTLVIGEDENKIEGEIKVPKQTLTINIAMNQTVTDNATAYQDMKVVISGGDLAGETLTFDLGTNGKALVNGAYNFGVELTQNRLYTVTVSGAGYRTARYTVAMTEDKTMNFWNNVMSNEITVVDDVKDTVNFLAGDIVKDGKINIYDLSAVVAYFGTENNQAEYSKFAKYDLNRDGKIDMMDISIVLTSWGK